MRIAKFIFALILVSALLMQISAMSAEEVGQKVYEVDTIEEALKEGNFSGTIGSYFEFTFADADDSNYGWSNAYLTLKYETSDWNNLRFGVRFFAHGELFNDHDHGTTDPFEDDIETNLTLPEMYLNYGFLENSSVTIGRWKNVGHLADSHSEGGYVSFNEIENIGLTAGITKRFADIDYDDSEDFGRTDDSQEMDSENTFGAGSAPILFFVEGAYKPIGLIEFNPYFIYHDDYANTLGIDTSIDAEWEEHELKYGGAVKYVHVNAEITGSDNANLLAIQPYVEKGPVKLEFSYSKFADGDALNAPEWLDDPWSLVDQDEANGSAGAEVFEAMITCAINDSLWVSYAYATANYDTSSSQGEGYSDNEFQIGYDITDSLDINVRYFIVTFDDIDDRDYNKVETRMRFKF